MDLRRLLIKFDKTFNMGIAEKKQNLMHLVEEADENLTELLMEVAKEYNDAPTNYSKEELQSFYNIRDEFIKSGKKGKTVEEVHNNVRRNYKNGL